MLLPEVKSPVLSRPSGPPRHQYKPHTLSLRLNSHEAQASTPSQASFHHPRRPYLKGCVEAGVWSRVHPRLGCYSLRLGVRFWAVVVPLHVTSTSPIPFPCGYTHMTPKPAHLHEPPFTARVDRTSKGAWRQVWGRAHPRLGCYSLRLGVRFWAVLVPL